MPEHEGAGEVAKTEAELLEEKKAAFNEDPDRFADTEGIIVAIGRSDKGPTLFLNAKSRIELTTALGEIQVAIMREVIKFDNAVATDKRIIMGNQNKSGFRRFIRGR